MNNFSILKSIFLLVMLAVLSAFTMEVAIQRIKYGNGPIFLHINNKTKYNFKLSGIADIPAQQKTIIEGLGFPMTLSITDQLSRPLELINLVTHETFDLGSIRLTKSANHATFSLNFPNPFGQDTIQAPIEKLSNMSLIVNLTLEGEHLSNASMDTSIGISGN